MDEIKKRIQETVIPEDITVGEIKAIYEMGTNPFDLIVNAFTYGFLKGMGYSNA